MSNASRAPGPRGMEMAPVVARLRRDAAGTLRELVARYGDVVQFNFFGRYNTLIAHPAHVRQVLKDQAQVMAKGAVYKAYAPLLGDGLLSADGTTWSTARRLVSPAFRSPAVAAHGPVIGNLTAETLDGWAARLAEGENRVDMVAAMSRLTFRIIARSLFTEDLGDRTDVLFDALEAGNREGTARIRAPLSLPLSWPTPANLRYRRAVAALDSVVEPLIDARAADPDPPDDFFTTLVQGMQQGTIDRRMVRDQAITFLFAGHETTSNALCWSLHLLSADTAVQEAAREEVRAVTPGAVPDTDSLARLPYVRAVFEEAMRLYPPIYAMQRRPREDVEIAGYPVPAGSGIAISPYVTHRHPDFWTEPDRFRPDRFLDREAEGDARFSYFPFGAGPRTCIGADLAMMEGVTILAMILDRFRVSPEPGRRVERANLISMTPHGGLPLRLARIVAPVDGCAPVSLGSGQEPRIGVRGRQPAARCSPIGQGL